MSKNITIQEGGIAKQMTVDKLKTNLVGSGTCLWVPEDEVQLTTKTITQNGTYKASDDGYYGYEQVVVSVSGVGTATGTDGDGDEVVAHPTNPSDPDNPGELQIDKVPSSIEVITPPTNPYGIYQNGQSISTAGMVVKAYLKTGGEYGTVPNGEITLNPATAVYDATTDRVEYEATSELETVMKQPIASVGGDIVWREDGSSGVYTIHHFITGATASFYNSGGVISGIVASETGPVLTTYYETYDKDGNFVRRSRDYVTNGRTYTYNGKTVYSYNASLPENATPPINTLSGYRQVASDEDAWTIIYGSKTDTRYGSRQQITVSWPRPLDGKVLETTFEILVAPPYSTEE